MIKMWFKLNDEKLATGKYTREAAEKIIRDFFAKHKGVEIAPLTFVRDDDYYAIGAFTNMFAIMMHDADFMDCLEECKWSVNGHIEDCLHEMKDVMEHIVM
jgi:hypothetical protein